MTNKTLVFSIALNGYQWLYQKQLASHKQYANTFHYDYQAITRPYFSSLGVECCWLKLTLLRAALLAGYQKVMFLDADAFVQPRCHAIESIITRNKHLYLAKGYSGRFNSGVLIANNHPALITWLSQVINARYTPVEAKNNVGWGENGHIIEFSQQCSFIEELEQKWNNTFSEDLDDFIRHQNCGPLRVGVVKNFIHRVIFSLSARLLNMENKYKSTNYLDRETEKIMTLYPNFKQAN